CAFTCSTASPSPSRPPCSSPSTSGGCARTAASAGHCKDSRPTVGRPWARRLRDQPIMHNHDALSDSIQTGLGVYYLVVAAMNLGFAGSSRRANRESRQASLWTAVAALFVVLGFVYLIHQGWTLPQGVRDAVNNVMNPVSYFVLSVV